MCCNVYVNDRTGIYQARQLAELIGRGNILWCAADDNDPPISEPDDLAGDDLAWCLCPVDIEATMERAGYEVTFDGCDYIAHKEASDGTAKEGYAAMLAAFRTEAQGEG